MTNVQTPAFVNKNGASMKVSLTHFDFDQVEPTNFRIEIFVRTLGVWVGENCTLAGVDETINFLTEGEAGGFGPSLTRFREVSIYQFEDIPERVKISQKAIRWHEIQLEAESKALQDFIG